MKDPKPSRARAAVARRVIGEEPLSIEDLVTLATGRAKPLSTTEARSIAMYALVAATMQAINQLTRATPVRSNNAAPSSGAMTISNGACARARST